MRSGVPPGGGWCLVLRIPASELAGYFHWSLRDLVVPEEPGPLDSRGRLSPHCVAAPQQLKPANSGMLLCAGLEGLLHPRLSKR